MNADHSKDFWDFQGRRALVTGASRGIGRAIASGLARAGAQVAVHYRSRVEAADEVVQAIQDGGGEAFACQADLTERESICSLVDTVRDHWPALDILINNAGDMVKRSVLTDADNDLIDQVLSTNLRSVIDLTRHAIPLLKQSKHPAIVNLTSISAYNGGQGGVSLYAAAKGGIVGLTRSLARELGPSIRVNAVAPGVILTDIHRNFSTPEGLDQIADRTPLGRNGDPEEVTGSVLLLAGAGGSFITGEVIHVNGGLWMA